MIVGALVLPLEMIGMKSTDVQITYLGGYPAIIAAVAAHGRAQGWTLIRWLTADNNYRGRGVYDRVAKRTMWITSTSLRAICSDSSGACRRTISSSRSTVG